MAEKEEKKTQKLEVVYNHWAGSGWDCCIHEVHIVSSAVFELKGTSGLKGSKGHTGQKVCLKERYS